MQCNNRKERQSLEGVADQKKQRQKGRAKAKRGFYGVGARLAYPHSTLPLSHNRKTLRSSKRVSGIEWYQWSWQSYQKGYEQRRTKFIQLMRQSLLETEPKKEKWCKQRMTNTVVVAKGCIQPSWKIRRWQRWSSEKTSPIKRNAILKDKNRSWMAKRWVIYLISTSIWLLLAK